MVKTYIPEIVPQVLSGSLPDPLSGFIGRQNIPGRVQR
jgi:hypothetical protein